MALDPVGPGLRPPPIYLEGRGPIVDGEQARLLGLRHGQVIQAVITGGPSALQVQWPPGMREGLPTALQAFPLPSAWRWAASGTQVQLLAMLMPGGHVMLRPLNSGAQAAASAARPGGDSSAAAPQSGSATAGAATAGSAAMGSASAAAGKAGLSAAPAAAAPTTSQGLAAPPQPPMLSLGQAFAAVAAQMAAGGGGEVARLLQQSPALPTLLRMLQVLGSNASGDRPGGAGGASDSAGAEPTTLLEDALRVPLPRMAALNAEGLRQAMSRSGLGTEAALMAGASGLAVEDLKVALRRLLRHPPPAAAGLERALTESVDELERHSLESLKAQMQGQVLLSMAIPFGDAGPVALRIFRDAAQAGQEPPPYVVDIHSRHSGLGPLWLRTAVKQDSHLSLTMWAERPEVAELARQRARDLRWSLTCSGLRLDTLQILDGPRPGDWP